MKCALTHQYHKTLSELTQLAYAAAVDSSKWQLFLDRTSVASGGIGTHLFGHDDSTNSALGAMFSGYDPVHTDNFHEYYGQINSWAPGLFKHDAGVTLHTELMCPEKELIKTEFYSDWCQPQGDLRTGGGVILFKEASRMFCLGGNIRKRDSDHLDSWWLKFVSDITPHMQQALEISRVFEGMRLEQSSLARTGSPHGAVVIVINDKRQLVHANEPAWQMLEAGDVVRQSLGGIFDFHRELESREFDAHLAQLRQSANQKPVAFTVTDGLNTSYVCRVVQHKPEALGFAPIGAIYGNNNPFFLITLAKPLENLQIVNHLKTHFGVTYAEARVVVAITEGMSPDTIARTTGKSLHTVRNQLKQAMSKLNINRQAELATFIERLRRNSV